MFPLTIADAYTFSIRIENIEQLRAFAEAEGKYWNNKKSELIEKHPKDPQSRNLKSAPIFNTESYFSTLIDRIDKQPRDIQGQLNALKRDWVSRTSTHVPTVVLLQTEFGADAVAMYRETVNGRIPNGNLTNQPWAMGVIQGILYKLGHSDKPAENLENITKIVEELAQQTTEATALAKENEEKSERYFAGISLEKKSKFTEWNKDFKAKENRWETKIDNLISEKNTVFNELENTYQEKLKLEAPVKLWEGIMKRNFRKAVCFGVATILLMLATFYSVYHMYGVWAKMTETLESHPWLAFSKGAVLTGTVIGLFVYAIKTTSKLLMSSLHLYSDAEERKALTYAYLSMVQDGKLDSESDRQIILQSLFSRTDTGLHSESSGPIIPGPADIIKEMKGN